MFIPLVIGVIIFLFIIIIAFSYTIRSQRRSVYSIFKKEIAFNLAEAGLEQASAYFNSGESALYKKLVDPAVKTAALRGMKETFRHTDFPYLEKMADRDGASVRVDMTLQDNIGGLWDSQRLSGDMHDMAERVGQVLMKVEVEIGGKTWIKEALKEVKMVNILPSFLSKFTLFVKTPMANLNLFLNDKQGNILNPVAKQPIFLFHRAAGEALDVRRPGWVFLGGGTWHFNLTSGWGNGLSNSEDFHYLAFDRVCVFEHTESGHGNLDQDHVGKIIHRGFHKDLEMQGPQALFPATTGRRSNAIHLFGSYDRQSPTLVLGRVFRRYAQYGALCLADPDTSDTLYPPKVILPYVPPGEWAAYNQAFPEDPVNFPMYTAHNVKPDVFGEGDYTDRPGARGFSFYMSKIVDENEKDQGHYNNSYDMISQGNSWYQTPERKLAAPLVATIIESPSSRLNDPDYFYSADNGNEPSGAGGLCIKRDDGTAMFRGNLNDVGQTFLNDLDYKALTEVTADEFKEIYLKAPPKGGPVELHLGTIVKVSGSLQLDRPLVVKDGGIILVDRNVIISDGIRCDAQLPLARTALTICSRDGSIIIRTGSLIQAALIALNGSLIKDSFDQPVLIRGAVAVGSLHEDTLFTASSAGSMEYDERLNPLDSKHYRNCYRARVLPREIVGRFFRED